MFPAEHLLKKENFSLKTFDNLGYSRQKCKKCGKFFWCIAKRDTCGDSSCDVYSFIGNPIIPGKWEWKPMQRKYLNWFSENGHTAIDRYSTIARWKPDTLFVGASIFCFMPWVLNRTIDPPANPLVIPQPSIRFVDIDNVGLGSGRHCTEFTMFGHHAFNYPKKMVYWKDSTVELCHNWFKSLKVDMRKMTFVEGIWKGGGWAGPCFEVMLGGNEVATLVFMEYEGPNNGFYRPLPGIKVVDTGYGLERMVWASQGTPTIYDAIHKNIIAFLKKEGRVADYNSKTFAEFCKLSASLNVEEVNVEKQRKIILEQLSKKTGVSVGNLLEEIYPYHNIYRIADHSKALMFLLGDGIVPSNMQAGYLARLLARRGIQAIQNLGLKIKLGAIVEKQIKEVADIYPEFSENKTDILKMVEFEEEKYKKTISNAKGIVVRFEDMAKKSGKNKLTTDDFAMMYSSHGLMPEIVAKHLTMDSEKVTSADIREKIKSTLEKEEKTKSITSDEKEVKPLAFLDGLEDTEKLYYKNEHCYEFNANVVKVFDNMVVLNQTAFYPRGGGAEPDLGTIDGLKVLDVEKNGNIIVHIVDGKLQKGQSVKCVVDKERRDRIVRHHTATHIVNGAARQVLGNHIWQEGTKKDFDKAHLNVSHFGELTQKQVDKIQKLCNEIVVKNLPVLKELLPRTEAEHRYGFRIYQGGAVPGRELRIVGIKDWDVEACGGLHKDRTGEVGKIIISKIDHPREGAVRFVFHAGPAAQDWIESKKLLLKETAKVLGVPAKDIPKAAKKLFEQWKKLRKQVEVAQKKKALRAADDVKFSNLVKYELFVKEVDLGQRELQEMSKKLSDERRVIILFGQGEKFAVLGSSGKDTGVNIGLMLSKICSDLKGKGGGSPRFGQGFGTHRKGISAMVEKIKKELG
jgi:alanyl-tRNA synthetase